MRRGRAGTGLTLAALGSALLALILICGFFGIFGVGIDYTSTARLRIRSFALDRGRIRFRHDDAVNSHGLEPAHELFWMFRPEVPELRYSFWEFDARPDSNGPFGIFYIVAFPIWCVLLPCLIAPLIWLRRVRRTEPRGFAVIQSTDK